MAFRFGFRRALLRAVAALALPFLWSSAFAQEAVVPEANPAEATTQGGEPRRFVIRFLTESEFPPFNYYDDEGVLSGFNVDLARAICLEASAACDIKVRPWEELLIGLRRGDADAVIAAHRVTAGSLAL